MSQSPQNLRLRRPEQQTAPQKSKTVPRHTGILQDQLRRSARRIWSPSFSLAVRMLLLVRVAGAMYSNIDDCDEVYNFWEPLHFLDRGYGFQTWEVSPEYAIRSWAYIMLHLFPVRLVSAIFPGADKRPAFFAVRIALSVVCALAEANIYRTVFEKVNERVGRYLFFMLLFSAGMWNSSAALLPSSFAMYCCTLAFSYTFTPSSLQNSRRVLLGTIFFATGAIVGWPFCLALAIPFVFEELFVPSADRVNSNNRLTWAKQRWIRFLKSGLVSSTIFIPVVALDSVAYGKLAIVPWNIIRYNIFGGSDRGPDLYGTEPWYFYLFNLVLNFNILVPLAVLVLPILGLTYIYDRKRLGIVSSSAEQSSPFTVLALRLAPFYVWIAILTLQAHKEERFMFPAYPLLCFNAAVALYLLRGLQETVFIAFTKSPYKASQSTTFRSFTFSVIIATSIISVSRVLALGKYYHTPLSVVFSLQTTELPRLLNETGLLPLPLPNHDADDQPRIDLTPIKQFDLRLCVSKEWYRFPGHFLVTDGVRVDFVKSDFSGQLPGHFGEGSSVAPESNSIWLSAPWKRPDTRLIPSHLNDLNKEDASGYVTSEECDYMMDLDFPENPSFSFNEPRYVLDAVKWDRVDCKPFLDARNSNTLTRILWMPGQLWQSKNQYGDYCLLRNRRRVAKKIESVRKTKKKAM